MSLQIATPQVSDFWAEFVTDERNYTDMPSVVQISEVVE
jgi:hypothetical protein